MARAPVSKTGGWGFESLHSCQGQAHCKVHCQIRCQVRSQRHAPFARSLAASLAPPIDPRRGDLAQALEPSTKLGSRLTIRQTGSR
jgi:hypothetical protein